MQEDNGLSPYRRQTILYHCLLITQLKLYQTAPILPKPDVFLSTLVRDLFGIASELLAELPNKSRRSPEQDQKKTGKKATARVPV